MTLSHAWDVAESSLPAGWRLRGLELLTSFARQADPPAADQWHAWASEHRHGEGSEVYGAGLTPVRALDDLAAKLRATGTATQP